MKSLTFFVNQYTDCIEYLVELLTDDRDTNVLLHAEDYNAVHQIGMAVAQRIPGNRVIENDGYYSVGTYCSSLLVCKETDHTKSYVLLLRPDIVVEYLTI